MSPRGNGERFDEHRRERVIENVRWLMSEPGGRLSLAAACEREGVKVESYERAVLRARQ